MKELKNFYSLYSAIVICSTVSFFGESQNIATKLLFPGCIQLTTVVQSLSFLSIRTYINSQPFWKPKQKKGLWY